MNWKAILDNMKSGLMERLSGMYITIVKLRFSNLSTLFRRGENKDMLSIKKSKFEQCIEFILDREGRIYENNPDDPGGETKFGISKKSYPNLDIKNLTEDQAKAIYLQDYWRALDCDQYELRLALAVFDTTVNQGAGVAHAILAEFRGQTFTVEQYLFRRLRRYSNLVQANPKLKIWLDNWLLRVIKIVEYKFNSLVQ